MPKGVFPEEGARIKNLQEPERLMSTSAGAPQGVVRMIDPPDVIRKKFKTAVTDSGREVVHDPEAKPGVSNLIEIMSVATGAAIPEIEARYDGAGYGPFKDDVAEAVVELLDADPGALPRAARRRRRAAAAARDRSGEGGRGVGADARAHVRRHGLRQALSSSQSLHLVGRQLPPFARFEPVERRAPRSG